MIVPFYPKFLTDIHENRASEEYWRNRWNNLAVDSLSRFQWTNPWLSTGSSDFLDGNPIFSAYSPVLSRGVRIIQHEPTSTKVEAQAWPDFVGGNEYEPLMISELVLSCALSADAADWVFSLIRPWVDGKPVILDPCGIDVDSYPGDLETAFEESPYTDQKDARKSRI